MLFNITIFYALNNKVMCNIATGKTENFSLYELWKTD